LPVHNPFLWKAVSVTVHLPEELSRRLEAVAAERGVSPEQLAVEVIEAQLPTTSVSHSRFVHRLRGLRRARPPALTTAAANFESRVLAQR